jgi:hypothetical protein
LRQEPWSVGPVTTATRRCGASGPARPHARSVVQRLRASSMRLSGGSSFAVASATTRFARSRGLVGRSSVGGPARSSLLLSGPRRRGESRGVEEKLGRRRTHGASRNNRRGRLAAYRLASGTRRLPFTCRATAETTRDLTNFLRVHPDGSLRSLLLEPAAPAFISDYSYAQASSRAVPD